MKSKTAPWPRDQFGEHFNTFLNFVLVFFQNNKWLEVQYLVLYKDFEQLRKKGACNYVLTKPSAFPGFSCQFLVQAITTTLYWSMPFVPGRSP